MRQVVKLQRESYRNDMSHKQSFISRDFLTETPNKIRPFPLTDGSIFIKKRMKDIYMKTEGCEKMISLAASSQRQTPAACSVEKSQVQEAVRTGLKLGELNDKQLYSGLLKWYSGGLGVMKKVQTGKIRRIKLK